jgi:hypothetical protein
LDQGSHDTFVEIGNAVDERRRIFPLLDRVDRGLIEQWKEKGQAPDQLIVSHFKNGVEVGKRLVCQYPQIAMYKGSGDQEAPSSYTCR